MIVRNTVNIINNLNIPNVSNNMMDVNTSEIVHTQVQKKKIGLGQKYTRNKMD